MQSMLIWACVAIATGDGAWQAPPVKDAVKRLDPVELCEGRETPGQESLTVEEGRYRYFFATAATKARFVQDPNRYGIQLGGACGRMGLLSGKGDPSRFAVHDGRIYIFASSQCLNGFKTAPEKCLDAADAPPQGTKAQEEQAARLLAKALDGLGGAAQVDAVQSLQAEVRQPHQTKEGTFDYVIRRTVQFPHRYCDEQSWQTWRGAFVVDGADGWNLDKREVAPLADCEKQHLVRQFHRHPLMILKARQQPGFKAVAVGQGKAGETPVELVQVGIQGATTTLGIDPVTGRVLSLAFRGRHGSGLGDMVKTFSDFRTVNGITLPFKAEITFNGKPQPQATYTYHSLKVNEPLPADLFTKPVAAK